jgi:hypothetical protein
MDGLRSAKWWIVSPWASLLALSACMRDVAAQKYVRVWFGLVVGVCSSLLPEIVHISSRLAYGRTGNTTEAGYSHETNGLA